MENNNYPDVLTSKDVCQILQISRHTLYKLINSKDLKAKKIAQHYRIQKSELLRYLTKD